MVKIYAIGDKHNIQELKQHAEDIFKAHLYTSHGAGFSNDDFLAVMPLTYATTPDTDRGTCGVWYQNVGETLKTG